MAKAGKYKVNATMVAVYDKSTGRKDRYFQGSVVELTEEQATRLTTKIEGLDRPPAVEEYREDNKEPTLAATRGQESFAPQQQDEKTTTKK